MAESRPLKPYRAYEEQVEILRHRGMQVGDVDQAAQVLRTINYYRLSGYWYPFRQIEADATRSDQFVTGTTLADVLALYQFDERLRVAVLATLAPLEVAVRALLAHELGRVAPLVHLDPTLMGPTARRPRSTSPSDEYVQWRARYDHEVSTSREDFVEHHREDYGGQLPIWVAVETMDWGRLSHLFRLSPIAAQEAVAAQVGLAGPQFGSWMKTLNIVRNYAAHHARMFNRVYALAPRLPRAGERPQLTAIRSLTDRTFGQLSLVQYLQQELKVGNTRLLPSVMRTYPEVGLMPPSVVGLRDGWPELQLWR